jgi:hypothetical protein
VRVYDGSTQTYIDALDGIVARHLVWFTARNRSTGAAETIGIWNGDDHQNFTIGTSRTYYGAGSLLDIEPITAGVGLTVRIHQITMSGISPQVEELLRTYDARLAAVEMHRALFSLSTGSLVGTPYRVMKGWVNGVKLTSGEDSKAVISVASAARALTKPLALYRSDAAMRERSATDTFRAYADISGQVGVWWGEKREGMEVQQE